MASHACIPWPSAYSMRQLPLPHPEHPKQIVSPGEIGKYYIRFQEILGPPLLATGPPLQL